LIASDDLDKAAKFHRAKDVLTIDMTSDVTDRRGEWALSNDAIVSISGLIASNDPYVFGVKFFLEEGYMSETETLPSHLVIASEDCQIAGRRRICPLEVF
jgi:hypothetical protein